MKNMYKQDVEDCVTLRTEVEKVQSHYVSKLWYRIVIHLYHGTLNIMLQITTGLSKGAVECKYVFKWCTLGKYKKSTFHDQDNKALAVLKRIHSDVY